MKLAHAYAKLVQEASDNEAGVKFADKLLAYMKSRGHLSLLPQVVNILKRMPSGAEVVVTVANEKDLTKYKAEIKSFLTSEGYDKKPRIVEDSRIVGGYLVRAGSKVVDKTFRSALVDIYQKTVRS